MYLRYIKPVIDPTNIFPGGYMKLNMGLVDRIIRIVLATVVAVLYFTGLISGTAAIILGIFAAIFLLTSLIGFCPLYLPLKISTIRKKSE